MADSLIWVWFQTLFGIGTRRSHALMEYFPDPTDILEGIERRNRVLSMLREEELLAWEDAMRKAEEIHRRTRKKGCEIITPDHPHYPPLLQDIFAKPAALYVKGDLSCLRDTLVIAMVGTRTFSEYGKDVANHLAGELAACGVVVVSGLAKGIDSFCHAAALEAGGKSIGILGCGIDVDYPKGNAPLKRSLSQNGAVVSEFPLGEEPKRGNFPLRNRIISGMADGTVVVEADLKSGSMLTAMHASDQNREVFAVPGDIFSVREQGTHKLIKDGAKLTECVGDIFEEFSHRSYANLKEPLHNHKDVGAFMVEQTLLSPGEEAPEPPLRMELPEELSREARDVYALIKSEPIGFEELAGSCDFEIGVIQSALTELEIYALIRGYPGRRFSL